MVKPQGPVLIDLDGEKPTKTRAKAARPDTAPPVPEAMEIAPGGHAMQGAFAIATRRGSRLGRWFFGLLGAILSFGLSLAAWDFVTGLVARNTVLGYVAIALVLAFLLVCAGIIIREWAAFSRLRRIDGIRLASSAALASGDLGAATAVNRRLLALYAGRVELEWGRARMAERTGDVFDADGLLGLAEAEVLAPLDGLAQREVEAAARQVATVTAIVPLALADVATALVANVRMIRRIAEIYGGRAGALGSWRLARSVMAHLVATGAVAVGDDMISSIAGGGVLSKLSRRFGEGIINGALTARVGVAAMEVCRPLPFRVQKRPGVTGLVKRALVGLFGGK
ncbi:MAG: TIGR01620 family protein [Paracoccaceae bacterium]